MKAEILKICLWASCHFVVLIDPSVLTGGVLNKCPLNEQLSETGWSSLCLWVKFSLSLLQNKIQKIKN